MTSQSVLVIRNAKPGSAVKIGGEEMNTVHMYYICITYVACSIDLVFLALASIRSLKEEHVLS